MNLQHMIMWAGIIVFALMVLFIVVGYVVKRYMSGPTYRAYCSKCGAHYHLVDGHVCREWGTW